MIILCGLCFISLSCLNCTPATKDSDDKAPTTILWAWERPEDLRFIPANGFGIAFLSQTIYLENDDVRTSLRRQPLEVPKTAFMIAVTRIETKKTAELKYTDAQLKRVVSLVENTAKLQNIKAIQIDFDAVRSERDFYRKLIKALRERLPRSTGFSITALASWCIDDRWISGLPVDEAVPMLFRMGPDGRAVRGMLKNNIDFSEPLCKMSYGLSLDERLEAKLKTERRFFYFNPRSWRKADLGKLER